MKIYLYQYSGENIVLDKTGYLGEPVELDGILRDECDISNPIITMQADPRGYNYAYIPSFNRYYFIGEPTVIRTGIWRVPFKVDVLTSFSSGIGAADCICIRTSKTAFQAPYIPDPRAQMQAYNRTANVILRGSHGSEFVYGSDMILITAG